MKRFITFALLALAVPAVVYATVFYLEDFNGGKVGTSADKFSCYFGTFGFTQAGGDGGFAQIAAGSPGGSGNSMLLWGSSSTGAGILTFTPSISNQNVFSFRYNANQSPSGLPPRLVIVGTNSTYQVDLATDSSNHQFYHNHPDPIVSIQIIGWDHQSVVVDDYELTTCENCQ